jgi:Na+-driven multidrug efflux pump
MYLSWKIDTDLWKRMMRYGTPIMVAGSLLSMNNSTKSFVKVAG